MWSGNSIKTIRNAAAAFGFAAAAAGSAFGQSPWAAEVITYDAGVGAQEGYTDPASVLGEPSRMTGSDPWVGAVTPFNTPWLADQIVSIGGGGSLTVRFDEPITNDASHLYGMDFIVFGNGSFSDAEWPSGIVGGLYEEGPFSVWVSGDGVDFVELDNGLNDAMYPMLGYSDLSDAYATEAGSIESDFTKPVNPAFGYADFDGLTFGEVCDLYDGSGGGMSFDIAGSGLDIVNYVRIDVAAGASSPEFDGFAIVPEPAGLALLVAGAALAIRRGR